MPLARPPARFYPAMSYDPVRREIVLFGGEGFSGGLSDTWVWDGVNWTQRFPAASPAGRRFHGMAAFNALSSTVVMFGGETLSFLPLSDTWVWDGVSWKQLSFTVRPSARSGYAVTYDEMRGEFVLFGSTRPDALNDTWVFGADP
jgi:hypothetical protein